MKKIFTLIVVATMAISANAQETYAVEEGFLPDNAGETREANSRKNATSVTLTFGADGKWDSSNSGNGAAADASLADLGFSAYISGGNNPKDGALDGTSNSGSGYSKDKKNLPISGTYYVMSPTKSGSIQAGIVLNGDKSLFVTDGEGNWINAYQVKDKEGNVVELDADLKAAAKTYGTVTFNVEAGKSYYVFCTGSKLGFYGFIFSEETQDIPVISGIKTIAAKAIDLNAPAYNLAGQKVGADFKGLVIKNGVKVVIK